MIYSNRYKYVYFAPPKTGTSSVATILRKQYEGVSFFGKHAMIQPPQFLDYFSFATVRNPYTRVVSEFNYKVVLAKTARKNGLTVEKSIGRYPVIASALKHKNIRVDRFIHLENLQSEFLALPFVRRNTVFYKKNVSVKYLIGITEEHRQQIAERYAEDFEAFGYDPNECPVKIFKTLDECFDHSQFAMVKEKIERRRLKRERNTPRVQRRRQRRQERRALKVEEWKQMLDKGTR